MSLSIATKAQEPDMDDDEGDFADPNQPQIDSLISLTKQDSPDSVKAKNYYLMAKYSNNYKLQLEYATTSLKYCSDTDTLIKAFDNSYIGSAYYMLDESQMALPYYFKAMELFGYVSDNSGFANQLINIGNCYEELNMQDSIFYYYNLALKYCTAIENNALISYIYQRLALVYSNIQLFENGVEYYHKGLEYAIAAEDNLETACCYLGIGEIYSTEHVPLYFKSVQYLRKAVAIFEEEATDDSYYISCQYDTYSALSYAYINIAKTTGERKYADSCNIFIEKVGDFYLQQGNFQSHVATRYSYVHYLEFNKEYRKALAELIGLAKYIDKSAVALKEYHRQLYQLYLSIGDYKNALENLEKYNEYRFAFLNDSTLNTLKNAEVERTRIIEELKRENAEKTYALANAKLSSDRNRMIVVIVVLALGLLLIVWVLWRNRTFNKILQRKNEILNIQKTEIETQRDEIAMQNDIITEQMQNVESANNKIVSSINYASRIQRAAVSSIDEVKALFHESFVFYKPRDIVSGDFYRCGRCGKYSVMITADCTGHGIPGAFLSMLGLSALKEFMVYEYDAANPGTVLDRIRSFIKTTFAVSPNGKIIDDGMDMTICCYDFAEMQLRYAIANQVAYIIRDGKAIKLKGDNMPVGNYVREKEHFQTLTMPIKHGDMVYTFSDGIQDQIGGSEQRKFLMCQLLEIMIDIAEKPIETQSQILEQRIVDWRGDIPQVDDMTLVGIRV